MDNSLDLELQDYNHNLSESTAQAIQSPKNSCSTTFDQEFDLPRTVEFQGHDVVLEFTNVLVSHKLKFQALVCFLSLGIIGLMDQAVGSILHYLLEYYDVDRSQISYLFLLQFVGYMIASFTNEELHNRVGMQYLLMMSIAAIMFDALMFILKVPLFMLYFGAICFGSGAGSVDCILNLFVGKLKYSNQLLGAMHGFYGVGCFISPILAISLIEKGVAWNNYYFFMLSLGFSTLLLAGLLFRNETKWKYKYSVMAEHGNGEDHRAVSKSELYTNRYIILFSLALFIYVGTELCIGIWLFNYLLTTKKVAEKTASYITSSYWACLTVGRFALGFITGHFFENCEIKAMLLYTSIIAFGCFNFWAFSNNLAWQVISIDLAGLFVGPMFATNMVIAIKILPKAIANAGVAIVCGMGSSGAAVIPWVMGIISESFGDGEGAGLVYFPAMIFVNFFVGFILWLTFYLLNRQKLDNYERLG